MEKIKRIAFCLLLTAYCLLITTNCRKKPEGFDMSYRRQFQIASGLNTSESHNFLFNNIAADTAVFFTVRNATRAQVAKVYPKSMNIRALFANDALKLSIINQVEVFIFDPARPALGEPTIFYRDQVPVNVTTQLDLVPNNVDISKFLFDSKTFSIKIKIRINAVTTQTTDVEWNSIIFACESDCE